MVFGEEHSPYVYVNTDKTIAILFYVGFLAHFCNGTWKTGPIETTQATFKTKGQSIIVLVIYN